MRALPFFQTLLRLRYAVMALALMISIGIGYGMSTLAFSNDYRDFFAADDEKLVAFEALQDKFVRTNNVYLGVVEDGGNIYAAEPLSRVIALTERLWELPFVVRVDSPANHQFVTAEDDDIAVWDLTTSETPLTDASAQAFHTAALAERGLYNLTVTEDPAILGINISLADAVTTEAGKVEFMAALDALLADIPPGFSFHRTGSIVVDHGFDVSANADLENLYSILYVLVLALAFWLTRSIAATIGILLTMTLSWFIALGAAGLVGLKLTAISVAAPTVLMTLAVAYAMHVVHSVQKMRAKDMDMRTAVAQAMAHNIRPLFLVSLSTLIGFVAIMASEVPPLRDLGFMLSVGAVAIFGLSVTFLPAFLSLFPMRGAKVAARADRQMTALGGFIADRAQLFGWIGVAAVLLAVLPVTRNVINDNFVEYFDSANPVRKDAEAISDRLTGIHYVYFEVESPEAGGVFAPAYLDGLDRFAEWLRAQPEIRHVTTYADTQKRLNQASLGDAPDAYALAEEQQLATQLHLLYEMSLPFGLATDNLIDIDQRSTRLSAVLGDISSAELLMLETRIADWHAANVNGQTLHPATGPMSMFAHIGQRNAQSLVVSTVIALLLVSATLTIALGSLRLGLVSLLPNLMPAFLAFGIWGLLDGQVGLAISIVAVMTFGIVVDDTVFLLTRFRQNASMPNFRDALIATYRQTGRPIINTTIVLTLGFSVLAFSSFRLNEGLGILTALVVALALICDLFVLPALLRRVFYTRAAKVPANALPAE